MAIATVDRGGTVVRANARFAKLAQAVSPDGAANKSIFRTVNARDRGMLIAAINQAAEGQGDIAPVEAMLDGAKERWGQFFVTSVEEDERETEAAIVYLLETTERRALENQINQSQKMDMVGQLAGGIAHDFNNVLSAIMMANDFLLNAHKPTDPSFQDIMQIKQNATRAATLVRQLLAFSRRQTLRPQVLDLGDALSDLTMLLRRLIGEKVKLDLVHGRDLWPVKVDVSQFEQVIVNLAVNARDAMPEGGRLLIEGENVELDEEYTYMHPDTGAGLYVRLKVSDTGVGMDKETVERVFEPFFTTKSEGTGLGLATVYGIVTGAGGRIDVYSEPGIGTTIKIHLPATSAVPLEDEPERGTDATGHGEVVLVVEDEPDVRRMAERILTKGGYSVIGMAEGSEAVATCQPGGQRVDLLLTDVIMPEMLGTELVEKIRELRPDLPVVYMSGYSHEVLAPQALTQNGDSAFIEKPFSAQALKATVRELLDRTGGAGGEEVGD